MADDVEGIASCLGSQDSAFWQVQEQNLDSVSSHVLAVMGFHVHIEKMSSIVWCDLKHACAGALPLEHTKCDQTPWL